MKGAITQFLLLCFLAAVAGLASWKLRGEPDPVAACVAEDIPAGEICLTAVPEDGVLWIDARARSRYEKETIPGALLLNTNAEEDWQALLAEVAPRMFEAELVVVFCDSAGCGASEEVASQLRELELGPEIKVLHGGWKSWQAAR
ncbi:MAG: rhodanese-like domain-containing protein [Verrucomicrobiales bacterium]